MIGNADPADEKKSAKGDIRENADPAGGKKSAKGDIRESADPAGGKKSAKGDICKMLTRPMRKSQQKAV